MAIDVLVQRADQVPARYPVDAFVRLAIKLLPQLTNQGRLLRDGTASVEVTHGQVHNAAVAPPATRMEWYPVGQHPELRRDAVDPIPRVHSEHCKPELAPLWNPTRTL